MKLRFDETSNTLVLNTASESSSQQTEINFPINLLSPQRCQAVLIALVNIVREFQRGETTLNLEGAPTQAKLKDDLRAIEAALRAGHPVTRAPHAADPDMSIEDLFDGDLSFNPEFEP